MNTVECTECGQEMITSDPDPAPEAERYCPDHHDLYQWPSHGKSVQRQQARDVRADYNRARVIDNDRGLR